jgi:7-cyano-7-deazaguanine synthase
MKPQLNLTQQHSNKARSNKADPPDGIVVYSGGLDSTVLLYSLASEGMTLHALSVHYGQRHQKELQAAEFITDHLRIPHQFVNVPPILFKGSSQTSAEIAVPEGHYAAESMKQTVVPNRNMVLLSLAGAYAQSVSADIVAYAAHGGDHAIYPDCRPEFVHAMDAAFFHSAWAPPRLVAPFLRMSKAQIVELGSKLEVPFSATWSCYKGGVLHCGKCGTCTERREAFTLAGVYDPTEYEKD